MYVNPHERCLEHGEAWASTVYEPMTSSLRLNYIFVPPEERRVGIGKQLLRGVIALAEERGALKLIAEITSRECLDLAVNVFGEESVTMTRIGTYADGNPYESARAALCYYLER